MELKRAIASSRATAIASFNRTFMELKLEVIYIEQHAYNSFNRTFMELKLHIPVDKLFGKEF